MPLTPAEQRKCFAEAFKCIENKYGNRITWRKRVWKLDNLEGYRYFYEIISSLLEEQISQPAGLNFFHKHKNEWDEKKMPYRYCFEVDINEETFNILLIFRKGLDLPVKAKENRKKVIDNCKKPWPREYAPNVWCMHFPLDNELPIALDNVIESIDALFKWEDKIFKGEENMPDLDEKIALLEKTHNIIFTGAPGTGKTFLAKQIALNMITGELNEEGLSDEQREIFDRRYRFVQFHPSYDYTDFVEGFRPKSKKSGELGFELKDGIFKKFCKDALEDWKPWNDERQKNPDAKTEMPQYIFVIDEINRGEISKIFGELFFSIDPGYRGEKGKVQTQYANIQSGKTIFDKDKDNDNDIDKDEDSSKGGFYVPENVFIIGTMNDIDRSVESFDFAMRRRFVWNEIKAEDTAESMGLCSKSINRMNRLNKAIENIPGLSSAYHIGGAYFLKLNDYAGDYQKLWDYHIGPLIKEYLRGIDKSGEHERTLKNAYNNENPVSTDGEDQVREGNVE
jgi:5-methylcytosine-specific restriction endonuclease McrBC GTP-binding regulatory subunit McrB